MLTNPCFWPWLLAGIAPYALRIVLWTFMRLSPKLERLPLLLSDVKAGNGSQEVRLHMRMTSEPLEQYVNRDPDQGYATVFSIC